MLRAALATGAAMPIVAAVTPALARPATTVAMAMAMTEAAATADRTAAGALPCSLSWPSSLPGLCAGARGLPRR
jgi:hypothetical protein